MNQQEVELLEDLRVDLDRSWREHPESLWHGSKGVQMADHGAVHTRNLLEIADSLLALTRKNSRLLVNEFEFIVLYLALWLHDIGHRGSEEYQDPVDVRDFHGVISGKLLLEDAYICNSELYRLPRSLALPVALVSMYHQRRMPFNDADRKFLTKTGQKYTPFPKMLDSTPEGGLGQWLGALGRQAVKPPVAADCVVTLAELAQTFGSLLPVDAVHLLERGTCDLQALTALLRFVDTLDFRYNKVGSDSETKARVLNVTRERMYWRGVAEAELKQMDEHKLVSRSILDAFRDILANWLRDETMKLSAVDAALFHPMVVHKGRDQKDPAVRRWSQTMRYLAFLRDQASYYYGLHRSVLNVYFALHSGEGLDLHVDILTGVEGGLPFQRCIDQFTSQIAGEWAAGNSQDGENSVGACLMARGLAIKEFVFTDARRADVWTRCRFPDGAVLAQSG
ncbi:hypothetical protein FJY68_11745 [candidate division WOR-3 bacterium]|uniref:HD domain-containing protein n=1 Tax=candidate division WOR-3 bacterium TaxID=2052148 RepID=A0A937XJZ2_UNCW3|nr:hypothetical protein [candidate division WOR-3 bacterium]